MTLTELTGLRIGDEFAVRGRVFRLADYAGWTWGEDERGEFARFKAFNCAGRITWVTVRERQAVRL